MGWVLRLFQSRKRSLMLTLLKSLVIPLLEYCCQLWNPWKAKDIQAIQVIQRMFAYKITAEVQHLNNWERLHELKLYSLQRCCERYKIICTWKITHNMVPNIDYTKGLERYPRKHRRHGTQCVIQYPRNIPSTIRSRKCNNCVWASAVQLVDKISLKVLKLKNSNLILINL